VSAEREWRREVQGEWVRPEPETETFRGIDRTTDTRRLWTWRPFVCADCGQSIPAPYPGCRRCRNRRRRQKHDARIAAWRER
jgi:hypothetical protein